MMYYFLPVINFSVLYFYDWFVNKINAIYNFIILFMTF